MVAFFVAFLFDCPRVSTRFPLVSDAAHRPASPIGDTFLFGTDGSLSLSLSLSLSFSLSLSAYQPLITSVVFTIRRRIVSRSFAAGPTARFFSVFFLIKKKQTFLLFFTLSGPLYYRVVTLGLIFLFRFFRVRVITC